MRCTRYGKFLLLITFGVSFSAWGQGGGSQSGRGAPPQGPAAQQSGAGARGGRGGAGDLYNYDPTAASSIAIPDAPPVETHQKMTVNGEAIAYTARAGFMPLRNATTGQPEAHLFYTSYTRDGVSDPSTRPVLFFLGGGPGVSAGWQEFGGLGPKRMKWAADGTAGAPPYGWVDNPNTLLGQADMVFVNPVGTAYSRPDQPGRAPNFWTTAADIASLGESVRSYLSAYDRRNSPLFLAGEDFGTGRAAGLAGYLHDRQVPVQGLVLLSMTPSADAVAGDTRYITLLPSLVMAAWHHRKLAPELQSLGAEQIAEQARQFASRDYLHALYQGARIMPDERARVVANLSRLTGLSRAFIFSNDLRITPERFNPELLRDQRRTLSDSDARVAGFVPGSGGGGRGGGGGGRGGGPVMSAADFYLDNLAGGFQAAYESYLRRELRFTAPNNMVYYLTSGGVGTFTSTGNDDASLSNAFSRNPRLHLYVGVSFYDLDAPFYATEFTLAHLNVSTEVRAGNISVGHFEAGQLPYVDGKSLARLQADLAGFINHATAPAGR